jgi:hypothetical protein
MWDVPLAYLSPKFTKVRNIREIRECDTDMITVESNLRHILLRRDRLHQMFCSCILPSYLSESQFPYRRLDHCLYRRGVQLGKCVRQHFQLFSDSQIMGRVNYHWSVHQSTCLLLCECWVGNFHRFRDGRGSDVCFGLDNYTNNANFNVHSDHGCADYRCPCDRKSLSVLFWQWVACKLGLS